MANLQEEQTSTDSRSPLPRSITKYRIDSSRLEPCPQSKLYDLLVEMAKRCVVSIPVAECLVQTSPEASPFLVASERGAVTVLHGTHAFNKFFEIVDLLTKTRREGVAQVPKYLVHGYKGTVLFCMTKEECISRISRDEDLRHCYVRRFIKCKSPKPELLRVTYRLGKGFGLYLLKNNRRAETLRRFTELRKDLFPVKQTSIYQHKATDFLYAGKLLKTSFSPYLPYKSVLETHSAKMSPAVSPRAEKEARKPPVQSPRLDRLRSTELSSRELDFVVDTRDLHHCKVCAVEEQVQELETITLSFLSSLERSNRNMTVSLLTLDYLCSEDGAWYVQDCVDLQWEESSQQQRQAVDVKQKMKNLERLQLADAKRLEVAEYWGEGNESPVRRTTPLSSPRNRLYESEEYAMKSHLQTVQSKYDSIISAARRSKVLSRDLVAEIAAVHNTSKEIEHVLESALLRFKSSNSQLPKREFDEKKEVLLDILSGRFNNLLRSTRAAIHQKLGMEGSEFAKFVDILEGQAASSGISEASRNRILDRLRAFCLLNKAIV